MKIRFLCGRIFNILVISSLMLFILYIPQQSEASTYPLSIAIVTKATSTTAGTVMLKWTNYSTSSGSYTVKKKEDSGSYTTVAAVPYAYKTSTQNATLQWSDTTVRLGHSYTYQLYFTNGTGASVLYSDPVTMAVTTVEDIETFTAAPLSDGKISLNWTFPIGYAYAVVIERKTDLSDAVWSTIATVSAGDTSYTDSVPETSVQYYYRIKAMYSSHVYSVNFPDDDGINAYTYIGTPGTPEGYALSPTQIYISWTGVSNANYYMIERKAIDEASFKIIGSVSSSITEYVDSGLTTNESYTYRIKAINGTSSSEYSDETAILCIYLEAPSNLNVEAVTQSKVELTWYDNSTSETGFEIWKKTGKDGTWSKYKYLYRNETKYTDEEIVPGLIYYYKVRARLSDTNTYSAFSAEASTWAVNISPPTGLQYTFASDYAIMLSWTDNSNNESGFVVERKTVSDASWTQIAVLSADVNYYIDIFYNVDTQYLYRIKAYDSTGINAASYSEELLFSTCIPSAPSGLKATLLSPTRIKLAWDDNSNSEDGFTIERVAGNNATFFEIANIAANTTEYIDNVLVSGKYTYRIKAFNRKGYSSSSNEDYVQAPSKVTFSDLSSVEWARSAIENLASMGIFTAASDKKFRPLNKITRGEFVSALVKAFKLKNSAAGTFLDVSPRHKYYKEIMTAYRNGIAAGDEKNRFRPDSYVTREDMAVFVVRALNSIGEPLQYHDLSVLDEFSDKDEISAYAKYGLASLIGESLILGKSAPGDIYILAPKVSATKVEAASLIYRVIAK